MEECILLTSEEKEELNELLKRLPELFEEKKRLPELFEKYRHSFAPCKSNFGFAVLGLCEDDLCLENFHRPKPEYFQDPLIKKLGAFIADSSERLASVDLSKVQHLRLDDFSELPEILKNAVHLKTLVLNNFHAMISLPHWIFSLSELTSLYFAECSELAILPEEIDLLKKLKDLRFEKCHELKALPESASSLHALQSLSFSYCPSLTTLPESMGSLHALQSLSFSYCFKLTTLPESMGSLPALQSLSFQYCNSLTTLPESMGSLRALQSLSLYYDCKLLTTLPENIGKLSNLKELDLCGTSILELPVSCRKLVNITYFNPPETIQVPPYQVCEMGWPAVRQYLEDLAQGISRMSRSRIMILGDGGAGKTTLKYGLQLLASPSETQHFSEQVKQQIATHWTSSDPVCGWLRELGASLETLARVRGAVENGLQLFEISKEKLKWIFGFEDVILDKVLRCSSFLRGGADHELSFFDKPLLPSFPPAQVWEWVQDLATFLDISLPEGFGELLLSQEIDGSVFLQFSKSDLSSLGLTIGAASKIVAHLQSQKDIASSSSSSFTVSRYASLLDIPHVWTEGIDFEEWRPLLPQHQEPDLHPQALPAFTIWDFAGQLEYFPAHQFFLSSRNALYVLVLDASKGMETCRHRLMHWLSLIHTSTMQDKRLYETEDGIEAVQVVVVATHTDTEQFKRHVSASGNFLPHLLEDAQVAFQPQIHVAGQVFCVDYKNVHGGDLEELVRRLCALNTEIRHTSIPASYLLVAKRLNELKPALRIPFISVEDFKKVMAEVGCPLGSFDLVFQTLLAFGFIKQVKAQSDDAPSLLIDPVSWLCKMTSVFVLAPKVLAEDTPIPTKSLKDIQGLLNAKYLRQPYSEDEARTVGFLLESMDLCFALPSAPGQYVFPCLLPAVATKADLILKGVDYWPCSTHLFGRRFSCENSSRSLPPVFLAGLQMKLCHIPYLTVLLIRSNLIIGVASGVRFMVRMPQGSSSVLDVCVLCGVEDHFVGFALLNALCWLLVEQIRSSYPSLKLVKRAFCGPPFLVADYPVRDDVLGLVVHATTESSLLVGEIEGEHRRYVSDQELSALLSKIRHQCFASLPELPPPLSVEDLQLIHRATKYSWRSKERLGLLSLLIDPRLVRESIHASHPERFGAFHSPHQKELLPSHAVIEELSRRLEAMEATLKRLEQSSHVDRLEDQEFRDVHEKSLNELHSQVSSLSQTVEGHGGCLKHVAANLLDLRASSSSEIQTIHNELENVRGSLSELQSTVCSLIQARKEHQTVLERLEDSDSHIERSLAAEIEVLVKCIHELEQQLTDLRALVGAHSPQIQATHDQIAELQQVQKEQGDTLHSHSLIHLNAMEEKDSLKRKEMGGGIQNSQRKKKKKESEKHEENDDGPNPNEEPEE